jgi:nucleoside-diphosphate-sugar epimerase
VVTGVGGFIGDALCRGLRARGAQVWGLGRHAPDTGTVDHWWHCDIGDIGRVRTAFAEARPEIVFHLASTVTGARNIALVLPTLHDNLTSFVNVAVVAAGMGCRRIVTMGSLQEPDEALPAVPSSPYAAAKYAASCYARMFSEVFAVPVTIARTFMVYGPRQMDFTKLVPYTFSQLLRNRPAELSSGRQQFDWIHVDDVVSALIAIAAAPASDGRTIDVGTGRLTSVADVAGMIARQLGTPDLLKLGVLPDRTGEPTRCADVAAMRQLTGWEPRIDLETGVAQTAAWFKWYFAQAAGARVR